MKKRWHPDISNGVIASMEEAARKAGAWGYKVCGAGGQGYFLVIGVHRCIRKCQKTINVLGS
ncbi:hypothetical protein F4X88_18975 [Candidatus Poribacteria bacterium]|nr:hypothetical protein [Candidatus Poribacteria bacterium]MYA58372.1 hypothetical protein [Candidatus Poribacteria bacterium]